MKHGAFDFIEKPFNDQILLDQIQKAITADVQAREQQSQRQAVIERIELLTRRESEIMELVVAGKANKVIARELEVSSKTVEFHRAHIMSKMQVDSIAGLVQLVVRASIY